MKTVRFKDLAGALEALRRAGQNAAVMAKQTGTMLIGKSGKARLPSDSSVSGQPHSDRG